MSDFAPIGIPVMYGAWEPSAEHLAKAADRANLKRQRDAEDSARAVGPRIKRVAIASFMMIGEEDFPDGREINPGDTFEISEFDLPKYVGKSLAP